MSVVSPADPSSGPHSTGQGRSASTAERPAADRALLGIAKGSGLNILGALCTQGAWLLVMLLLGRLLGRTDVGRYAQAYAFLTLLGLVSLSGFRAALTRYVAVHLSDGDHGALRGTVRLGLAVSAASSAILAAALVLLSARIATLFGDAALRRPLVLVAVALPAWTCTQAALSATQGFQSMRAYALVGNILDPAVRLVLTMVALLLGAGVDGAMTALAVSSWTTTTVALVVLYRRMRPARGARPRYAVRQLMSFSVLSWLSSLATTALIWADTLILGAFRSSGEVGVYNVATRVVVLATFVMTPIVAAVSPRFALFHRQDNLDALRRTYHATTGWIIMLSLPAFVVLLVFPGRILHFFGKGFVAGATVTVLLATGKLVESATGPCGMLLNMSGHVRLSAVNNVVVLVLNVLLNLWLIPTHGIVGAAVAWSLSICLVNFARVFEVWWVLRIQPLGTSSYRGLAAGAAALAAALIVRFAPDTGAELITGVAAVVTAYLATLAALGLAADDRALVRTMLRRQRQQAY